METRKLLLYDGQALDRDKHDFLYQFQTKGEADIFTMYKSKLVLNFVGYIEFIQDNILHELYCFPKEYNVKLNGEEILYSKVLKKADSKEIELQFKPVIHSIVDASKAKNTVDKNDINDFYASNLHYLNEIIQHYNQYGIIVDVDKEYRQATTGKINWNKTIGKIVPKVNGSNFIYDRFVVEKNNHNITFLTQMISKVLFEGTTKYSFYLPVIDTQVDYSELAGISNDDAIKRLYELKNRTFKDYLHQVIDNLISYLQHDTVTSNEGVLVGTNNYNYVWEYVVAHGLGKDFIKADKYEVGSYFAYDKKTKKPINIEIDHINSNVYTIVDSKYYKNKDSEKVDYKQLFYNYYQVFLSLEGNANKPYGKVLEEYKKWNNVLIKPTRETCYPFSVYELNDNMKLYSMKINTRQYVENYVNSTAEGKLRNEIIESLGLELKEQNLSEAQE